jgi:SAM-dependent methyltransferase
VKPDATRFFVCPDCRRDLRTHTSQRDGDEIIEGELTCTGCGSSYPILRGVPRFVRGEQYADTFGRQWTRWARTQHDSLNGTSVFRGRMARYTGWTPDSFAGKTVVDAGCGPGGFIDVVERDADTVIGFDLSVAIDAAFELHGRRANVYLAQGDIFKPPLRDGIADRLYTFGVVQHTPDPERAFRSLIPIVKPGGEIAVWVYRRAPVPQPAYWMRRLTRGMREPRATQFIEWYVPKAWAASGALAHVPVVGKWLRRLVPVADYRDRQDERRDLGEEVLKEWAVMDTHDLLITRYTFPQRWRDLLRWMRDLESPTRPHHYEMSAVARRPAPTTGSAAR